MASLRQGPFVLHATTNGPGNGPSRVDGPQSWQGNGTAQKEPWLRRPPGSLTRSASGANSLAREEDISRGASPRTCGWDFPPDRKLEMADQYVPDRIWDFIVKHIDSVAQIEALLLVRSNPQERWNVSQIATRLYASETEVAEALDRLCAPACCSRQRHIG